MNGGITLVLLLLPMAKQVSESEGLPTVTFAICVNDICLSGVASIKLTVAALLPLLFVRIKYRSIYHLLPYFRQSSG
jgi:hypothetical protein